MLKEIICSVCGVVHEKESKYINQVMREKGFWRCKACAKNDERVKIVGLKFNRLLVIEDLGAKNKKTLVKCLCDCGKHHVAYANSVQRGVAKSCGCLALEKKRTNTKTHGMSKTRTYRIWMAMKARCKYPEYISYPRYGGRGISVCDRWMSFENFLEDMGEALDGYQIDRIDNDGNYEPRNCKWSSRTEQSRNKSTNRMVEFNGEIRCLKDWADSLNMDQSSLAERIDKWGVFDALTKPKGR